MNSRTVTGFFMIYNPNNREPRKPHNSWIDARTEADRLASKHPGEHFFILKTITCCSTALPLVEEVPIEFNVEEMRRENS